MSFSIVRAKPVDFDDGIPAANFGGGGNYDVSNGTTTNNNTTNTQQPASNNSSGGGSADIKGLNPLEITSITQLINKILEALTKLLIPVIIVMIVLSGFNMVMAQGNPEKVNKAGKMLLWVLVGAAVIIGAKALSDVLRNTVKDFGGSSARQIEVNYHHRT